MAVIEVSKELKDKFKKEHGNNVRLVEIPIDDNCDEYKEVLLKVPSRSVVSQYMRFSKDNPKKAQELLVKNCVLTGKEEIMEDDGLFYTTVGMIAELIPIREGKFKKL